MQQVITDDMLTDDQINAREVLQGDEFCRTPGPDEIILTGPAGTGKTTLMVMVIKHYIENEIPFTLTAMTHRAAGVMRNMLREHGLTMDVGTIHSALCLKVKNDNATGKKALVQYMAPNWKRGTIVVIDEASMESDDILNFALKAAKKYKCKLLQVGDTNQLPPVDKRNRLGDLISTKKMEFKSGPNIAPSGGVATKSESLISTVFTRGVRELQLLETVRAPGDSPITDLARNFIKSHTLPPMESTTIVNEHGRIELVDDVTFIAYAKKLAEIGREQDNPAHTIVLSFSNKNIMKYNLDIRQHVWGDLPPYQSGEIMVVNEPSEAEDMYGKNVKMLNNEYVTVANATKSRYEDLDTWLVQLEDGRMLMAPNNTLEFLSYKKKGAAAARKNKTLWRAWFKLQEKVCDLRPPHAVTIDKSQAGSFKHVLIDMHDIVINDDVAVRRKLVYTAMTRASHSVILTGYQAFWNQDVINKKQAIAL